MPTAQASSRSARPCRNSAALPYSASASTAPKRAPAARTRSISSSAIRHFGRYATASGTPAAARRPASPHQSSGRNSRRPTPTGTSARARVSETRAWQFAFLPSWPQYCRFTPTEWRPCFTSAVSSTTRAASGPPTSRSAAFTSSSSRDAVAQGEVETKWCSCWRSPGATRAAIGSTLLRSPGRDQALEVERRPAPLLLAPQPCQERLAPMLELLLPAVSVHPLHRAPPPRAFSRQERLTDPEVAG